MYLDKDRGLVSIAPGEGASITQGPGNSWIASLPRGEEE